MAKRDNTELHWSTLDRNLSYHYKRQLKASPGCCPVVVPSEGQAWYEMECCIILTLNRPEGLLIRKTWRRVQSIFGHPWVVSKNIMLYHRLHPTQNKNTYLHDMFRFFIKSLSGASHNKDFNHSVNAAYCVIVLALDCWAFNLYKHLNH
jgi:hypothetical protein